MTMSSMDGHLYYLQPGRAQHQMQHQGHDLTPRSAVSSFNEPAHCDSILVPPVSPPGVAAPTTRKKVDMNMALLVVSPSNNNHSWEGESYNSSFDRLSRRSTNSLHISTSDNSFPSPQYMNLRTPYFGEFGVSSTSGSAQRSLSSSGFQQSPSLQSAGARSNRSYQSLHLSNQNKTISRSRNRAPTLIAPNPLNLKQSAIKQEYIPHRQASVSPVHSSPKSRHSPQEGIRKRTKSLPQQEIKGRKGKGHRQYHYETLIASGDVNEQEKLLLKLTTKDHLPWKEVEAAFNFAFRTSVKTATLQMRKTRLIARLRSAESINPRPQQSAIRHQMAVHFEGTLKDKWKESWSKQEVQKHYHQSQPEVTRELVHNVNFQKSCRVSPDSSGASISHKSWSDHNDASSHSSDNDETWALVSAASTISMDDVRKGTASVASLQQQYQQTLLQRQEHALMFNQENWDSGA